MKVGVIGSREWTDYDVLKAALEGARPSVVLAGGAKGADDMAARWATETGIPLVLFKPYFLLDPYAPYSVRHYFTRNKQIIDNSDVVLAFWDGESPGTKWGINYAKKRGKHIEVYNG